MEDEREGGLEPMAIVICRRWPDSSGSMGRRDEVDRYVYSRSLVLYITEGLRAYNRRLYRYGAAAEWMVQNTFGSERNGRQYLHAD